MRIILRSSLFVCLFAIAATAQSTHGWEQSKFDEFEGGTVKGVSIRSDGALELAPAFEQISTTPSTYLWSIGSDAEGNLYAAAGAPARVYRITPKGETSVIFSPQELQVQALVVDRAGVIYAATSPDGKVYRIIRKPASAGGKPLAAPPPASAGENPPARREQIDPNYGAGVYFDPKTKYIWALALDGQGRLYVATGDRGEIFRVETNGTGSVFFQSDEAHIRAIAFAPDGNLIAGSDGSGLIYRITPAGEGFVLYGAPKKEITALALDAQGNIYAGAAGEKRQPESTPLNIPPAGATVSPLPALSPTAGGGGISPSGAPAGMPQSSLIPVPGMGAIGSEIYRIAPDGSPKRIWTSRENLVYSLAFDRAGRLMAGTGNKGRIYAIRPDGGFSDLLRASANQVIGFAPAPRGGIYTATSNLGKVFLMEDTSQREGTYDSDVFDARIFSRWGRAEMRSQGLVELFARSGNVDNPDRNWSHWNKVDLRSGAQTQVPPARYVQWRAVLHSGSVAPQVMSVLLNYLPKNVAPEVDEVTVQVGAKPASISRNDAEPGSPVSALPSASQILGISPAPGRERNNVTVHWSAHDDNDDQLAFSLYYRGDADSRWLLLKDGLSERAYSFDPSLLPDGGYTIRVVASDAPSHAPAEALTGFRDSAHFSVDTTPPRIDNLNAAVEGGALRITFSAADSFSDVQRAECSIDAGPWQFVAPIGEISDAKTENYDFTMPLLAQADPVGLEASAAAANRRAHRPAPAGPEAQEEHIVVVRVYDRADNVATAKAIARPKP